ncbi:MAG: hypothetical protein ABGX26_06450 [Nautiliaceae bacterium]
MTMQIDLRKVFKFDRELRKLIGQLEIFRNFLTALNADDLSKNDKRELIEIARLLWELKDEIQDNEAVSKIKELFRLIAYKVEEGETEEDKIWALRGDIGYLDYLDAKEKGMLITGDAETFIRQIDEL